MAVLTELVDALVKLYKRVATQLPADVLEALQRAKELEVEGTPAFRAMAAILENVHLAKTESKPICQDTGTPIFYVRAAQGMSRAQIEKAIVMATQRATREVPLRPNAVDPVTGRNTGNNVGCGIPIIHFEEWAADRLAIQLVLKGGGCENVGRMYRLPNPELRAERNLEGVRRCVVDAVFRAQGRGCPPAIVGVGVGGTRAAAARLSARQLLRRLDDVNPNPELAQFERVLCEQLNSMGIGPMGLGGRTAVLGVKVGVMARHPASFFVDVSFLCWAARRGSLVYKNGEVEYG
jgi:fumarate hydratase class I